MFQSPLGEVVKETLTLLLGSFVVSLIVSIPSRGSGKGDLTTVHGVNYTVTFQSPLGEVVKETGFLGTNADADPTDVSIPSRGSGKGDTVSCGSD